MSDERITLWELVMVAMLGGFLPLFIGAIMQVVATLRWRKNRRRFSLPFLIVLTILFSTLLSIFIWAIWPSKFDATIAEFILLPAVISEVIVAPILYLIFKPKSISAPAQNVSGRSTPI